MTEIITSDRQVYRHAKAVVSVADALRDQDFEVVDYLRCEELRLTVAPEIDQATLTYQYGDLVRENTFAIARYTPQELQGKFVKVVAIDTVYADAFAVDPLTEEVDKSVVWFGVIEFNAQASIGTTSEEHEQGTQQFVAFGMLRIAENCEVRSSMVDVDGSTDNLLTVNAGIKFNQDPSGDYVARGNRSIAKPTGVGVGEVDSPSYVFSWQPRGFTEWDAYTAVEYLLAWHSPRDNAGEPANVWRFADDVEEGYLDWYKITQETHGLNLKQLLDALIPRHRGVGYWLEFDITREHEDLPNTAANEVLVHVFTFNKTDVALPESKVLKANVNQKSLDFQHAYDIEEAYITNVSAMYDRIIAEGARRTTTFTTRIGPLGVWISPQSLLGPAWRSADEDEYKAGASAASDYSGLSTEQKENRNSVYRKSSERLHQVYRRFVLNTQLGEDRWDGKIAKAHTTALGQPSWWLRGDLSAATFSAEVDEESNYDGRDYVPGLRVRRSLPFYERQDYSGSNLASLSYDTTSGMHPSFIPLMAYARTQEGDGEKLDLTDPTTQAPHRYQLLDRLHQAAYFSSNRNWACQVGILDTEPGVELIADPPHFIGGTDAGAGSGWAATKESELSSENGGLDFTNMWVTLTVELNEHVTREKVLSEPHAGAPEKVLTIHVPDARHDYVIPFTTVEIKDGVPVQTTSGGAAVDSLNRLESIVRTAAEWYSIVRQALRLKWKQTRAAFQLGDLITDVGGQYQLTDINTPITAITYDFGAEHDPGSPTSGSTVIETAFTNLDFQ